LASVHNSAGLQPATGTVRSGVAAADHRIYL